MVTLREVAREVGMSPATVSRVLRGTAPVSAETREIVLSAVERLGYRPNPLAQGLRTGRSNAVALVISDIEQGWHASLTKHLQVVLEEIGIDLILMNLGHELRRLDNVVERAQAMRLRGVILAASDHIPPKQVRSILASIDDEMSIISIGQRLDRYGIPSFVHADTEAAETAVDYLLQKNGWPVAFCSRIKSSTMGRERFQGYRTAIERAGFVLDDSLVWDYAGTSYFRQAAGYHMMTDAIERRVKFRSVLAGSDEIALGAMGAALDRGLRIPDDVAIIGFGGLDWGISVRPRLTTLTSDLKGLSESVRDYFLQRTTAIREKRAIVKVFERELALRASA